MTSGTFEMFVMSSLVMTLDAQCQMIAWLEDDLEMWRIIDLLLLLIYFIIDLIKISTDINKHAVSVTTAANRAR